MASIRQLPSGNWQAQVRRKGRAVAETFIRKEHARDWAREAESLIDRGKTPVGARTRGLQTFEDLIDLHIEDMKSVKRPPGRTKAATLDMLRRELGALKVNHLDRERIVRFGRKRASVGAGPVTIAMDIGTIRLVVSHAAAVHGAHVSVEQVDLARIALGRLGLIGKSNERDRRPTPGELERLIAHFEGQKKSAIPMAAIIKFAVASAMRQEEIFHAKWQDLNRRDKLLTIRDRKDPREKRGNDQSIPLLSLSGYDALAVIDSDGVKGEGGDRIFPFNHRSAGTAFTRACKELNIADLHFHDLRHEATSRLFEAGLSIEQVALVTGHRDWKMLRRYTHLKPEGLHAFVPLKSSIAEQLLANDGIASG
jgi:integrase